MNFVSSTAAARRYNRQVELDAAEHEAVCRETADDLVRQQELLVDHVLPMLRKKKESSTFPSSFKK
jgi:hypothetical protein